MEPTGTLFQTCDKRVSQLFQIAEISPLGQSRERLKANEGDSTSLPLIVGTMSPDVRVWALGADSEFVARGTEAGCCTCIRPMLHRDVCAVRHHRSSTTSSDRI